MAASPSSMARRIDGAPMPTSSARSGGSRAAARRMIAFRSAVSKCGYSPVAPAMQMPETPASTRKSTRRSNVERSIRPSSSTGVATAAKRPAIMPSPSAEDFRGLMKIRKRRVASHHRARFLQHAAQRLKSWPAVAELREFYGSPQHEELRVLALCQIDRALKGGLAFSRILYRHRQPQLAVESMELGFVESFARSARDA